MKKELTYSIPIKHRKIENLHIVFWLFKDLSWCLVWKPLGILMIFPTITMAIIILRWSWSHFSERCHNLAVTAWITANAYWMTSEFCSFDNKAAFFGLVWKDLTIIPFLVGVSSLSYYYGSLLFKKTNINS